MGDFGPSTIGMCRCADCARTITVTRSATHGNEYRKYETTGCGVDRAAIVIHRWRWCEHYRQRAEKIRRGSGKDHDHH